MWKDEQLTNLLKIVRQAGIEILSVYSHTNKYNVSYKEDNSPITEADRLANNLIAVSYTHLTLPTTPYV